MMRQSEAKKEAAEKWRDAYHCTLPSVSAEGTEQYDQEI